MQESAPYGAWRSPITAALLASGSVRLGQVKLDNDIVYWVEGRPAESGRNVLMGASPNGTMQELTPAGFNVRTRAHEYGGGAYAVAAATVFFCNDADQRIYRQLAGGAPHAITPERQARYADLLIDTRRAQVICLEEDHEGEGEPRNSLIAIDWESGRRTTLAEGDDFCSSPALSPDGNALAWLAWNHPDMPWDNTTLWLGELAADGSVRNRRVVAGGHEESVFQPCWSPTGELYFVSDRTGWWNLYRLREGEVEAVLPKAAEFGLPQWVFGLSTYAFVTATEIVAAYLEGGESKLARIDCESKTLQTIDTPYSDIGYVSIDGCNVAFHGGAPDRPDAIVRIDLATGQSQILRVSSALGIDTGYFSTGRPIEFRNDRHEIVFGFFYAPMNRDFLGPASERPPLIVVSHGGPTSATSNALKLNLAFWTSRGFAVLDVNYGGSTGFGRPYRRRLDGQWGVVDVADCIAGARHVAQLGLVDAARMVIRGSSAGGYTTLCALTFHDLFKAGASYYGVSDLTLLAEDTHKFESRYLDRLIGAYPARKDLYLSRSPIHHVERLRTPVIFLQGLEDKVVPPNQAQRLFDALRSKRVPTAFLGFEGEQHGFRKSETVQRALQAELYFYAKVFGIPLGESIEPIEIHNLP